MFIFYSIKKSKIFLKKIKSKKIVLFKRNLNNFVFFIFIYFIYIVFFTFIRYILSIIRNKIFIFLFFLISNKFYFFSIFKKSF